MKDVNNLENDPEELKVREISKKEQYAAKINSQAFENLSKDEKKETFKGYFEAHLEEKYINDPERKQTTLEALRAHFDIPEYKELEEKMTHIPYTDMAEKKVLEKMDALAEYMGSSSIQLGNIGKSLIKYFPQHAAPINKVADSAIAREQDKKKQADELIGDSIEPEDGFIIEPPKKKTKAEKAKSVVDKYQDSIKLFYTKRASIFKQESTLHKEVGDAAKELLNFRKEAMQGGVSGPAESLSKSLDNEQDKMNYAREWLEKAKALHDKADYYVKNKTGLSFAGSDRKKGARDLRKLAKAELDLCYETIDKEGLSLAKIYKDICAEKDQHAIATVSGDTKMMNERTDADNQKLFDAVFDELAAVSSNHLIMKLEEKRKAAKVPLKNEDVRGLDFYSVRDSLMMNMSVRDAVLSYIADNPSSLIRKDMSAGPEEFINAIKKYNPDLNLKRSINKIGADAEKQNVENAQKKQTVSKALK